MHETNLVRPSRDGDQFHYLWAARRCLLLLASDACLKAISIEGASPSEAVASDRIKAGEELIDVAEYYGSENFKEATLIRYIQLKHSTLRVDQAWTPSELKKTLQGFVARYKELNQHFSEDVLSGRLEFYFISNRPISSTLLEVVRDVIKGYPTRDTDDLAKLEQITTLSGTELAAFCRLLHLEGSQEGLWDQQNLLIQDVSCYLADTDVDAPLRLKELVTQKALSINETNPTITRMDLLRVLKTDESRLFPAPCRIKDIKNIVVRKQESELIRQIVHAGEIPIIVHAAGGVGKSIFAKRINLGLPTGSSCILYDCFGNGQYRCASGYRHRHKDALIQIANELASKGLCHPLIPSSNADPTAYMRAFIYRLQQSISSLNSKNSQAVLCIIIDAADNAQMAAEEVGEARAFVRDIIREQLPKNVRLVALCRTHRQEYLDPPPKTLRLELHPFSRSETAVNLRQVFAEATEQDVDEFHHLSSHNPRIQALALSRNSQLQETLRILGPNPSTVENMINTLLDESINKLRDVVGNLEKSQIDRICVGLATLRPLIPLSVLALISRVTESAIKSFAFDLGRPLLVVGDTIQFFDEPAETWFRDRFKPKDDDLTAFVASLKPLATSSGYVASALPELMLEAGQLEELVALALTSDALPSASPVEKRDVELQRLQFALKASLRARDYTNATKLALKAGGESAGDERQRKIIQANTDLASSFLDSNRIQEIVSRRTFGSCWLGSHHAYEAALMSGRKELLGDAQTRLRMAFEWLENWARLPDEARKKERVSDNEILEMATAIFNVFGAKRCASWLGTWRPCKVAFRVGRILASRFIDHGRYCDLNDLALAAGSKNLCLVLAITLELGEIHRVPPKSVVERALRLALNPHTTLFDDDSWGHEAQITRAMTALAEAAHRLIVGTADMLVKLLTRHLPETPPRDISSHYSRKRFPMLRAYALRAALGGQSLKLNNLAHEELRKDLESERPHTESQNIREFNETIGVLLPWHLLWATTFIGSKSLVNLAEAISKTMIDSAKATRTYYQEESEVSNEVALIWFDILLSSKHVGDTFFEEFDRWIASLKCPLYTTTLTRIVRQAAQYTTLVPHALNYANKAFYLIQSEREDAELKSDSYVELSRAILMASFSESAAYFDQAVEVAGKIGDECLERWEALLDLADRAASQNRPNPKMAYRLARCAELTCAYVDQDRHFDWNATIKAISGLCAKSSLAIISRWRDRNFGRIDTILPIAVQFLATSGIIEPKLALALLPFRAQWDIPSLLKNTLVTCVSKVEQEAAVEFTCHYLALEPQTVETWHEIKIIMNDYGIVLSVIDEWICFCRKERESSNSKENNCHTSIFQNRKCNDEYDWNAVFDGIDLCITNDISQAYRRYKNSESRCTLTEYFRETCTRVHVGKEAEFISSITCVMDFDLYDFRAFFEHIPDNWKSRFTIKTAIIRALKVICRRFCMEITKSRYYETFPLESFCNLSGIPESDLVDIVRWPRPSGQKNALIKVDERPFLSETRGRDFGSLSPLLLIRCLLCFLRKTPREFYSQVPDAIFFDYKSRNICPALHKAPAHRRRLSSSRPHTSITTKTVRCTRCPMPCHAHPI